MHNIKLNVITGLSIVILYGLLINIPYFHLKEFQGEEGRRVLIAQEMLKKGDYIVPTVEGEIYLNKPPLFNWLLAIIFKVANDASEASARSVSVFSAILCAILLSLLWKLLDSKGLWILPGLIFLSLPDVLDKAIRAEIDITFTLTVTASLISWFYIYELKRNSFAGWIVSLMLLAIAFLTKGIISVFFFYLTTGLYLFFKKRLKDFFTLDHLAGIVAGSAVFSFWFIPLIYRIDYKNVLSAWINEIIVRKEPLSGSFWKHMLKFPYQFILGYMPWIGLLLFFRKQRIQEDQKLKDIITFSLPPLVIAFLLFWFIPGARVRYLLPLSGLFAISIAGIIETLYDKETNAISYTKVIAILVFLSGLFIPFLYRRFDFAGIVPWIGGLLLIISGVYLFFLKELGKRLIALFCIIFIAKTAWASIYFPYHEKNMSYYREAARRINNNVPVSARLYDYNLSNFHVTFYLERDVIKIKDFSNLKKGDYLLMRKTEEISLPCIFREIDSFKARKMVIGIYRKEEGC